MRTNAQQLSSLLYMASPSLPIGAFAYSQGLEHAIEMGRVNSESTLNSWCDGCIKYGLSRLDLPVICRLRRACASEDLDAFCYWNDYIFACRESKELYDEEVQLGKSVLRLLNTQSIHGASASFLQNVNSQKNSYLAGYALMSVALDLDDYYAALGFVWSWLENQVTVACKVLPLGQSDAQRVLLNLKSTLDAPIERSIRFEDCELFGSLPGQALISALHETQYSRLFRS